MKIAVVTFYPLTKNAGGGQTPAFAFKEWCNIFNIDCTIIGIINDFDKCDRFDERINIILDYKNINLLNAFDGIFFITPPLYEFNFYVIRKPFVFMIHGEGDEKLYGIDIIKAMKSNEYCKNHIHIDVEKYFNEPENGLYWYPCCSPNDLFKNYDVMPRNGSGILYASRISKWVNATTFVKASNYVGKCYMFGVSHHKSLKNKIINMKNNCVFSFDSFKKEDTYVDGTFLFWDVIGTHDIPIKFRRLSLSAYEALQKGYMPIVSKGTAPKILSNYLIEIDPINFDAIKFLEDINNYNNHKEEIWININNTIQSSHIGYEGVKFQVKNILIAIGAL